MADLPLPVLPCAIGPLAEVTVTALGNARRPPNMATSATDQAAHWIVTPEDNDLWLYRADIGAFLIERDGAIVRYRPTAGAPVALLRGALVDHVLPRTLSHRGHLILHAASVACVDRVLALLGPSGTGKSTLAVAAETAGLRLLGDDSVRITTGPAAPSCIASYPGARLHADSVAAFGGGPRFGAPGPASLPKHRYRPAEPALVEATRLVAFVHLERQQGSAGAGLRPPAAIDCARVPITEAAALLTCQSFALDPTDGNRLRRLLALTAATAAAVPVYRLRYPSGYEHLPAVCERLAGLLSAG